MPRPWRACFLTTLYVLLQAPAVRGAIDPDTLRAKAAAIDAYLVRLGKLGFAGVFVLESHGDVLVERGCGFADREKQLPWKTTAVSDIGSITKQFTAAAILRLQEQGRLHVDDALTKHIETTPPDKAAITLHHLLTHTSGIVDVPDRDDWDPVSRDDIVQLTLAAPLDTPPGTYFAYSNAGYSLLGVVIEKTAGKSYEAALRELLFEPAGLRETGYVLPQWDPERIAVGYRDGERWGTTLERPFASDGPYWILRANGGLHSTAPDMLRWARALLDDRVLSPSSRTVLWSKHADESNGSGDSFYGYGWSIGDLPDGSTVVTHNGGNGIHFADFAIVPAERIVAFFMTNVVSEFYSQLLLEDVRRFMLTGVPLPEVPDVQPLGDVSDFLGTYDLQQAGAGGAGFNVRVDDAALAVEAHSWRDFSRLYGAAPADLDRLEAQSATIDTCVTALLRGDYGPMHAVYFARVPMEVLRERGEMRRRDDEQRYGPLRLHRTLGTLRSTDGSMTFVRFEHERGVHHRRYVWSADGQLRGVSATRRAAPPRFYRTPEGSFVSFEVGVPAARIFFVSDKGGGILVELGDDAWYRNRIVPGIRHVVPGKEQ